MKNLFILILTLFSITCFAQTTPTGFTRYYSNVAYDGLWPMKYGAVPLGDTMVTVKGIGQMIQDSTTGTVWHVVRLTGKRWEVFGGGAGTGVTSVGMSIGGTALSISPSSTSSSATFAHTWNGTSNDVVLGNGTYTNLGSAVQAVGDLRYMALGSTFPFSRISDGPTAVGNLFNAGPGLTYDPTTRTYTASGAAVQDGLLQGGVVTWSGTGLIFDITTAKYVLGGSQYTSPYSQVTLDPADVTYGRYDAIIVTNSGTVSKITGTAAASPVLPQSDPASQIILTYVFVDAGATTPTQVSNEVIYDENVEWTHTTSGSVTANFASTSFAQQGTKSIQTTWSSNSNLIFTNGSNLLSGNYTTISFYIKLSGSGLANNTNVSVQFYNNTNAVSNSVPASFSKTSTLWQLVSFNVSQFSFTSTSFNSVRFILTGSTIGTLGTTTVFFDNIRLQAGITPPTTVQGLQSAYTKVTDGTTIAAATGSDQLRYLADNTMSVTVANNDATYGDYVKYKVDTTKIATKYFVTSSISSTIPTLQQVTDAGSLTTNTIGTTGYFQSRNDAGLEVVNPSSFSVRSQLGKDADSGFLMLYRDAIAKIRPQSMSINHTIYLPNTSNSIDTLATLSDVRGGGGTISAHGVTVLKNYVTQTTSTGSGTTDNVTIVNVPANTLSTNGDGIEIEVAFTTTGVDTKSVGVSVGSSSTLVASSAATTAATYSHKIKLYRTSSTGAVYRSEGIRDNNQFAIAQSINTSFDWTTSQDVKVQITSTTAASITINYVTVKIVKQ